MRFSILTAVTGDRLPRWCCLSISCRYRSGARAAPPRDSTHVPADREAGAPMCMPLLHVQA